jgi:transcriptional regulator of arginine metabolism
MSKSYRQGQILKLVRSGPVATQEELAESLKKVGIQTTQTTLSRDIRELRLVKTAAGYRENSTDEGGPQQFAALASEFLMDVRSAQNLVVLKTAPGDANSVAVALDNEEWPEIIGTIAGDDTILVIAPNAVTATRIRKKLLVLLKS